MPKASVRKPKKAPEPREICLPARGRGQPTKYRPEFAKVAGNLAAKGFTDAELADAFGVAAKTFQRWKAEHSDLAKQLLIDSQAANNRVELSLYQQAIGYEREEEEIIRVGSDIVRVKVRRYYPPVPSASIYWSKVKMGWREQELPPPPSEQPQAEGGIIQEPMRNVARRMLWILNQAAKEKAA